MNLALSPRPVSRPLETWRTRPCAIIVKMAVLIPLLKTDQVAMVAVAVIFGSVSTTAVSLRLFVALRISRRRLDASDICIVIAWFLMMGLMVTCVAGKETIPAGYWALNVVQC